MRSAPSLRSLGSCPGCKQLDLGPSRFRRLCGPSQEEAWARVVPSHRSQGLPLTRFWETPCLPICGAAQTLLRPPGPSRAFLSVPAPALQLKPSHVPVRGSENCNLSSVRLRSTHVGRVPALCPQRTAHAHSTGRPVVPKARRGGSHCSRQPMTIEAPEAPWSVLFQ